jgi:hypothetical protein
MQSVKIIEVYERLLAQNEVFRKKKQGLFTFQQFCLSCAQFKLATDNFFQLDIS